MMKRANGLLPQIAEPDNLRLAFWKAAKRKRYKKQVLFYQSNLDENLIQLRQQVLSGQVKVGCYHNFVIYEPKQRLITAPAFREQVLHHSLMNVCHDTFECYQIFDSYASRKGKGTYAALDRAKFFTHKYDWFVKLDVRQFFASISHTILMQLLKRRFKETRLLHVFDQIIGSYPPDQQVGLPIGNLTSQYFANHFLAGLDHFIKEELRVKAYVRYMDDMVVWGDDKQVLRELTNKITNYAENVLALELKPPILQKSSNGLPFLGYVVYPHFVRLHRNSKQRFRRKLKRLWAHLQESGREDEFQERVLPLLAFTQHADTFRFRKNVLLSLEHVLDLP